MKICSSLTLIEKEPFSTSSLRYPTGAADLSAYLLQAQSSGAHVVGFANAGADTVNNLKQAAEFGLSDPGQKLVGLLVRDTEIHALGLKAAQGLKFVTHSTGTKMAKRGRFRAASGRNTDAADGSAGGHLQRRHALSEIVQGAGTDEAKAVMAKMKALPIDDFMTKNAWIRGDGRVMRDMYLAEVKALHYPSGEWDLLKIVATLKSEDAFLPLAQGEWPAVKPHRIRAAAFGHRRFQDSAPCI